MTFSFTFDGSSSPSVLDRITASSLENERTRPLSAAQAQVDGLVSRFTEEATNWRSLAAMATGSLFYRFGRIGTLALASRLPQAAPLFQVASYGIGLGVEVTAFEGSSRFLAYASGDRSNANLWRWSGRGGWSEGLSHSLVTFGMLKSFGHLGSEQNVVLQHVMSDLGMVGGHQVSAALGFTPRPEGSLASQFLEAEITNLQLGAGMSLLHMASPRLAAFERGLDLSIAANETPPSTRHFQNAWRMEAAVEGVPHAAIEPASLSETLSRPLAAIMIRPSEGETGKSSSRLEPLPPVERLPNPPTASLPPGTRLVVNGRLLEGDLGPLQRVLSRRAGRRIDLEKILSWLTHTHPRFPVRHISFQEMSNGALKIEGDFLGENGLGKATYRRVIQMNVDATRPLLVAMGDGLEVFGEHERGKGLGTHLTLSDLLFFRELGVSTFFVPAGRNGGHFWATRGFDFVDAATREKKLMQFREYLAEQRISLSPREDARLTLIEHSWELAHFKMRNNREVGREFLSRYEPCSWLTSFDLDAGYPGWRLLREALDSTEAPYPFPEEIASSLRIAEERRGTLVINHKKVTERSTTPLARLQRAFPLSAPSVEEALALFYRLPSGYKIGRLSFNTFSDRVSFSGLVVTEETGRDVADFHREIHFSPQKNFRPYAKGRGLDVRPEFKQQGIGGVIVANELLFLKRMGIANYEVPVGKQGGAFWPKMGFDYVLPEIGEELKNSFRAYLAQRRITLSPEKERELSQAGYSWELLALTGEDGSELGKDFFLEIHPYWESLFLLQDSYPGWAVLRRALRRKGHESLLPTELGRLP
ncbi:MAG: hypothetical protein U1F57_07120 [bacterium]